MGFGVNWRKGITLSRCCYGLVLGFINISILEFCFVSSNQFTRVTAGLALALSTSLCVHLSCGCSPLTLHAFHRPARSSSSNVDGRDRTEGLQMRGAWRLLGCWAAELCCQSTSALQRETPLWGQTLETDLGEAQEEVSSVTSPHKQWRSLAELRDKRSLVLVSWVAFLHGLWLWLQRCLSFSE